MARSITKISKELEELTTNMKKLAKEYTTATGAAKEKTLEQLKKMTKQKVALNSELDSAIRALDKDVELRVDEVRKAVKEMVRTEMTKIKKYGKLGL